MMEKKDARLNLEKHRATVFGIGLLAAGSFTLAAFTYTSPVEVEEAKIAAAHSTVVYEVAQEEPLPEEQPKTVQESLEKESTTTVLDKISDELTKTENSDKAQKSNVNVENKGLKKGPVDRIQINVRKVESAAVMFPDKEAEFTGGVIEMKRFIGVTQRYPEDAIRSGEEGTAYVKFIVETDGRITGVKAEGDVDRSLKREAERIVRKFPKWIPGEVGGRRVRCIVQLPITFVLE
jgi:protein TonB